ncbi:MAG TPA: D-aminoacyl-tRNA deacylase [Thermoanaerobaculia bacterium]|nr:D-aminoacyl-tRNA deacylase [Thermoanaerobaculia bacterium]
MRLVLQRVESAAVEIQGRDLGSIGRGILVLVGIEKGDGPATVARAAQKLAELRIFADAEGRMNLDLAAAGGELLLVSQFTLAASLDRGRRPSFDDAAPPVVAEPLYAALVDALRRRGLRVATGCFGAAMKVRLVNDGPVTFVLDL